MAVEDKNTEETLKEAKALFNAQKYTDGKVRKQTPFGSVVTVQKGAISLFRELAEHGVAEASFYLAMSYLYGYGVDIDVEVAKKHLISAADGGYGGAESLLTSLGVAYVPAKRPQDTAHKPAGKATEKSEPKPAPKSTAETGNASSAQKPKVKLPHKIMNYYGGIYNGEVGIDGKPYGHGKLTDDDGVYEGSWKNGTYHGNIVFTDKHGARELREYRDGVLLRKKPLAPGEKAEWTAADEPKPESKPEPKPAPKPEQTKSKSKPGIKLPHKIMNYYGGIYNGEVGIDGKPYGHGKLTDDDGVYEGSWKNGTYHGNIVFTDKHGARELHEYRDGELLRKKSLAPGEKAEWTAADEPEPEPEPKPEPEPTEAKPKYEPEPEQTKPKPKPDEYEPKKEYIPPEYTDMSHGELKRRAFRGDISAMFEIADRYNTGSNGYPEYPYKAVYWLRKAARLGDKDAALMLARYYYDNICYMHNRKAVIHWYQKALPHPEAEKELDEIKSFCKPPETEMDIEMLRMASDLGNVQALLALARYFERRSTLLYLPYYSGVPKEYEKRCYQSANDLDTAFKYYKRAAVKNNEEAMLAVANIYELGHICADDRAKEEATLKAMKWHERVHSIKNISQAAADDCVRFFHTYNDFDEGDINDIIHAAEQGNPDAMVLLAKKYERGDDVPWSNSKAIKWIERATKANIPAAMRLRGDFYEHSVYNANGRNEYDKDYPREYYENAMYWYSRAHLAHAEGASYDIACMYDLDRFGKEDERDELYRIWMRIAVSCEQYHPAVYRLAENYEKGHRMQRDMGEAYHLIVFLSSSDPTSYYGKKAMDWLDKHEPQPDWFWEAAQDDKNAWKQYALGVCYYNRSEDEKAKYWLKRAAANGSEEAEQFLNDWN